MTFDYLILNGLLVDGTGRPARPADLGFAQGRIAAVSRPGLLRAGATPGRAVVDATGLVVMPGLVDIHSHSDMSLWLVRLPPSKVLQGVTTEVVGNCGMGLAPLDEEALDRYRTRWPAWDALYGRAGREWRAAPSWPVYLAALEALDLPTNIVPLLPHGPLRETVVGGGDADPVGVKRMTGVVREAMAAGAFGLSTGLVYPPCQAATATELVELAIAVAREDGLLAVHVRGEDARLMDALQEVFAVARIAGEGAGGQCPRIQVSHLKLSGQNNWGGAARALAALEEARSGGVDVMADAYPYTVGGNDPIRLSADGPSASGTGVKRLMEQVDRSSLTRGLRFDPEHILVVQPAKAPPAWAGWTLGEASRRSGLSIERTAEVLLESQSGIKPVAMAEADVRAILRHPLTAFGSDAQAMDTSDLFRHDWVHPRNFGTYPRLIGFYARDEGLFDLETAVYKAAGLPASRLGLADRGTLAPGKAADLVILDYRALCDRSSLADPFNYPSGIRFVFVNGRPAVWQGVATSVGAGQLLRRPRRRQDRRSQSRLPRQRRGGEGRGGITNTPAN